MRATAEGRKRKKLGEKINLLYLKKLEKKYSRRVEEIKVKKCIVDNLTFSRHLAAFVQNVLAMLLLHTRWVPTPLCFWDESWIFAVKNPAGERALEPGGKEEGGMNTSRNEGKKGDAKTR